MYLESVCGSWFFLILWFYEIGFEIERMESVMDEVGGVMEMRLRFVGTVKRSLTLY